jgi:hypothetical protein
MALYNEDKFNARVVSLTKGKLVLAIAMAAATGFVLGAIFL